MQDNNICHFIPYHKDYHSIHTINFVLETKPRVYGALMSEAVYKMYYVCGGSGFIHTMGQVTPLSAGDVFFTFPSSPFCIESEMDFSYMYISFLGSRANMIMEKLNISGKNFIFNGCGEIYELWKKGIEINPELSDIVSESILLYTFSFLGSKTLSFDNKKRQNTDTVSVIKKYVDDNFSNPDISLELISQALSYNKKYVSAVFKRHIGVGIAEYLNTIRIQHACTMMEQGFTSVSDIAACCGYSDAQYFSRVFKARMKMSPMTYIKSV